MKTFLYVAFGCVLISIAQAADSTITVGVVEGFPVNESDTGKSLIQTNLEKYFNYLEKNKKYDIIVLPEYGLTGRTYDKDMATDMSDLTKGDIEVLNNKAKNKSITLVASLLEKDGDDLYSTTVVLNGSAALIAKYRKTNLNATETKLDSENEVVTFQHNGATIGLLSGDDILYDEPTRTLIKDKKATVIIYTTSMESIGPFRTTTSLHAGFAKSYGVNLLVASLNDPSNGVSGSGIYEPCTTNAFITADEASKAISDDIKLTPDTSCHKNSKDVLLFSTKKSGTDKPLTNLLQYNLDDFTFGNIEANITEKELCDGSYCCNFTISSNQWNSNEFYWLAVSNAQKVCGLMSCSKNETETCGRIDNAPNTVFSEITIKSSDHDDLFVPYILNADMIPSTDLTEASFSDDDDKGVSFTTNKKAGVIAIGIVGAISGASSLQILASSAIVMSLLLKYLL